MIPSYIRPQLTIEQRLKKLAPGTLARMNAVVLGTQYLLSRYGKEDVPYESFNVLNGDQVVPFKFIDDVTGFIEPLPLGHIVDAEYLKVVGKDLEVQYGTTAVLAVSAADATEMVATAGLVATLLPEHSAQLINELEGRSINVGDRVRVTTNGVASSTVERIVTGLKPKMTATHYGSDEGATDKLFANNSFNPTASATTTATLVSATDSRTATVAVTGNMTEALVKGSKTSDGSMGAEFDITITGADQCTIISTNGLFATAGNAITHAAGAHTISTGLGGVGLTITITGDSTDLVIGDVYRVKVVAAYTRLTATQLMLDAAGVYVGDRDTTLQITVRAGGPIATHDATILITDSAGEYTPQTVLLSKDAGTWAQIVHASGLKITLDKAAITALPQAGLRFSDIYTVNCFKGEIVEGDFDGIFLDGPAIPPTFTATPTTFSTVVYSLFEGEIPATIGDTTVPSWEVGAEGVTVKQNIGVIIPERTSGDNFQPFENTKGHIALSYRAAVPAGLKEGPILVEDIADVPAIFGKIDMDNVLAYGISRCLAGANTRAIYALRVTADTAEDYAVALKKLQTNDKYYALCPLTKLDSVASMVTEHCDSMSAKNIKNWRRCYIGVDNPGEFVVSDNEYRATVTAFNGRGYSGELVLCTLDTDEEDVFAAKNISSGDFIELNILGVYERHEIKNILNGTQCVLVDPVAMAVTVPVQTKMVWADTPANAAKYLNSRASALSNRRAIIVWTPEGTAIVDGEYQQIPNMFLAAEIAGLRCSLLAWQGLTTTEVKTVTDVPLAYTVYTPDIMDTISASGVFVITQDSEGGDAYIRHQLTTHANSDGILYYEDSVGVNLDDLSYQLKDVLVGFHGKKNVTKFTISEIKATCINVLDEALRAPAGADYGPQLNGYRDYEGVADSVTVRVNALKRDKIDVFVRPLLPVPLNNLDVVLEGDVDDTLVTA